MSDIKDKIPSTKNVKEGAHILLAQGKVFYIFAAAVAICVIASLLYSSRIIPFPALLVVFILVFLGLGYAAGRLSAEKEKEEEEKDD